MTETKIRPQSILLKVATTELTPSYVGMLYLDSNNILRVDTVGAGIPADFVPVLPEHTTAGNHGPKVSITQTAADNALVIAKNGAGVAVDLSVASGGTGTALNISNSGTGYGFRLNQIGEQIGIHLTSSSTGYVGLNVVSQYGISHTMTANSGFGLLLAQQVNTIEPNSGYGLLSINKSGTGASPAVTLYNYGTGAGINVISKGTALTINQTGALNAINVIHSSTGQLVYFSKTPVNADMQIQFNRNDGSGDPDMYLTYWGQSDYNTLALTAGSGAGLHVNTSGNVIVSNLGASRFNGTAKLAVMDGNVGIGTISPTALLQINQTSNNVGVYVVNNGIGDSIRVNTSNSGSGIKVELPTDGCNGVVISKTDTTTVGPASGYCLQISNSSGATPVVINQSHTGSVRVIDVANSGTGYTLNLQHKNILSINPVLNIANSGTGKDIQGVNWSITKPGGFQGGVILKIVERTISGGSITIDSGVGMVRLIPETGNSDTLNTMVGGTDGQVVILSLKNTGQSVTMAETGVLDSFQDGGSQTLNSRADKSTYVYDTTVSPATWCQVAFINNA